jgi:hypothetical protein
MSALLEYVAATVGLESNGRIKRSCQQYKIYFATEFTKSTGINEARAAVSIGMARRTCRPTPDANHNSRRIASAGPPNGSYACINFNEVRDENLMSCHLRPSGGRRRKPRTGERARPETVG